MKRMKIIRLLQKLFRVKEGEVSPKFIKVVYYMLYPLYFYVEKMHHIKYDPCSDIYTIEGRKFSGSALIEMHYKRDRDQ